MPRIILMALLMVSMALPAVAGGITLEAGKDRFIQIGYRLQVLAQMSQDQAGVDAGDPTMGGDHTDLYLRRSRLLVAGQVIPSVTFFLQLDDDHRGKGYAASTGVKTRDAWMEINPGAGGRIMAGIFPVQFSRSRLSNPFSLIALDRPVTDEMLMDSTGLEGMKRDRGLLLWGNLGAFQYRIATGKGAKPLETGKEPLRVHGRIHLALGDNEEDFQYKESYLGEKTLFTVGYGFDRQDRVSADPAGNPAGYSAWTYDIAMEGKTDSGLVSLNGAYYAYDWGNAEKVDATGNYAQGKGWQATISYANMDKAGGFQPYLRYMVWDADSAAASASQRRTSLGFNVLYGGNDAKLVFDFEQVTYPTEGTTYDKKSHGVYSMQWQISF